jgi:hypothetical protein
MGFLFPEFVLSTKRLWIKGATGEMVQTAKSDWEQGTSRESQLNGVSESVFFSAIVSTGGMIPIQL